MKLPRYTVPALIVAAVFAVSSSVIGLVVGLNATHKAESLSAKAAGGSQTCSGGNLGACDRVCEATAARLVIITKTGEKATVYCQKSKVTAAIGGTHRPVGLLIPGSSAPTQTVAERLPEPVGTVPAPRPPRGSVGATETPSASEPTQPQPEPAPENPVGGVVETIKTTVCDITQQVLGNC